MTLSTKALLKIATAQPVEKKTPATQMTYDELKAEQNKLSLGCWCTRQVEVDTELSNRSQRQLCHEIVTGEFLDIRSYDPKR